MKGTTNIVKVFNKVSTEDFKELENFIDSLIKILTKNVINNNIKEIEEITGNLPLQITRIYEDLNIDENIYLKKAYFLGILQSFCSISNSIIKELKLYLETREIIENNTDLANIIIKLFDRPISINSLEYSIPNAEEVINKYKKMELIDLTCIGEEKICMLTRKGRNAYNIISTANRRIDEETPNHSLLEILDSIADSLDQYVDKNTSIKNICVKSNYIKRYDHITNFQIRTKLYKIFNNIDRMHNQYDGYRIPFVENSDDSFNMGTRGILKRRRKQLLIEQKELLRYE